MRNFTIMVILLVVLSILFVNCQRPQDLMEIPVEQTDNITFQPGTGNVYSVPTDITDIQELIEAYQAKNGIH